MLSDKQKKLRDGLLTASQIGVLVSGDETKIMNLWRLQVGDPSYQEEDLSDVWPVRLGEITEALNLEWYERKHGKLARRGEVVNCPSIAWAACTLDAWNVDRQCPVEAKHVNGFSKLPDVIQRYMPQLHWQMICTGATQADISVIIGAGEPVVETIGYNGEYASDLIRLAKGFWACVETLTPPFDMPTIQAPVAREAMIEIDMTGNNAWASFAADWLENETAAKTHDRAAFELKRLLEKNVAKASGHGVKITRDKRGALRVWRAKND